MISSGIRPRKKDSRVRLKHLWALPILAGGIWLALLGYDNRYTSSGGLISFLLGLLFCLGSLCVLWHFVHESATEDAEKAFVGKPVSYKKLVTGKKYKVASHITLPDGSVVALMWVEEGTDSTAVPDAIQIPAKIARKFADADASKIVAGRLEQHNRTGTLREYFMPLTQAEFDAPDEADE